MEMHATQCPKCPWMINFHSVPEGKILNSQLGAAYAENTAEHNVLLNIRSPASKVRLSGIIGTLGPSSYDIKVLENMMAAGMNIVRIKMCHCSCEDCKNVLLDISKANDNYSRKIGRVCPLAITLDLRGSEIRTGTLKDQGQEIDLVQGNEVILTTDPTYGEHVTGDMIYVDYHKFNEILEPGDHVYLDDGAIRLSAHEIVGSIIKCIIENAGKLASRVSVSVPGIPTDIPNITEKDREDIKFAVENKIDAIFFPGIKDGRTILNIRQLLGEEGKGIMIISKIDCCQAIDNIDAIIKESDGIMIDRGALGNELVNEKMFLAQKLIIAKCNKAGKPVICSTQLLDSMVSATYPTKPEASDIAHAVLDGADCFLLSKETAFGEHPVESIATLSEICREAEAAIYQKQVFNDLASPQLTPIEPIFAIAISAIEASLKCNAAVIVLLTTSGRSAKILTKYRPRCPIIAITRFGHVARQLQLYRGITSMHYIDPPHANWEKDVDSRIQLGVTWGKLSGFIRAGDAIVIVTGSRPGGGFTNSMKIVYASAFDALPPRAN